MRKYFLLAIVTLPIVVGLVVFVTVSNAQDEQYLIARGEYLVRVVGACQDCHFNGSFDTLLADPMEVSLAGGYELADQPWGSVTGPNLTVLGGWTAQGIENAIRYGIGPDGQTLLPPMPYAAYAEMFDEDMDAIIAYLQSLEPIENEIPSPEITVGSREDVRTVPEFDLAAEFPTLEYEFGGDYGAYLGTHVAACVRCHGATTDDDHLDPHGPLTGDVVVHTEFGSFQFPALLQRDLSRWSDDELHQVFTQGIKRNGDALVFMPTYAYQYLEHGDVQALVDWLRSQP